MRKKLNDWLIFLEDNKIQLLKTYFRKREIILFENGKRLNQYERDFINENNLRNLLESPYALDYRQFKKYIGDYAIVQKDEDSTWSFIDKKGNLFNDGNTWYDYISDNYTFYSRTGEKTNYYYICTLTDYESKNDNILLDSKLNLLCDGEKFSSCADNEDGIIRLTKLINEDSYEEEHALLLADTLEPIRDKNGDILFFDYVFPDTYGDELIQINKKEIYTEKHMGAMYVDRKGNLYDRYKTKINY